MVKMLRSILNKIRKYDVFTKYLNMRSNYVTAIKTAQEKISGLETELGQYQRKRPDYTTNTKEFLKSIRENCSTMQAIHELERKKVKYQAEVFAKEKLIPDLEQRMINIEENESDLKNHVDKIADLYPNSMEVLEIKDADLAKSVVDYRKNAMRDEVIDMEPVDVKTKGIRKYAPSKLYARFKRWRKKRKKQKRDYTWLWKDLADGMRLFQDYREKTVFSPEHYGKRSYCYWLKDQVNQKLADKTVGTVKQRMLNLDMMKGYCVQITKPLSRIASRLRSKYDHNITVNKIKDFAQQEINRVISQRFAFQYI